MWCQHRVPKSSRVFGSRGCYPALGQIPGESFCLGMLSPCLAPVCRGTYFRVKKRETNKGALKIIEVGKGGGPSSFPRAKNQPQRVYKRAAPGPWQQGARRGRSREPGEGSLRGCRGRAVPAGGAVPGPPFPGAQRHPAERPGRRHGGLPAAGRGSRRPRSPPAARRHCGSQSHPHRGGSLRGASLRNLSLYIHIYIYGWIWVWIWVLLFFFFGVPLPLCCRDGSAVPQCPNEFAKASNNGVYTLCQWKF